MHRTIASAAAGWSMGARCSAPSSVRNVRPAADLYCPYLFLLVAMKPRPPPLRRSRSRYGSDCWSSFSLLSAGGGGANQSTIFARRNAA